MVAPASTPWLHTSSIFSHKTTAEKPGTITLGECISITEDTEARQNWQTVSVEPCNVKCGFTKRGFIVTINGVTMPVAKSAGVQLLSHLYGTAKAAAVLEAISAFDTTVTFKGVDFNAYDIANLAIRSASIRATGPMKFRTTTRNINGTPTSVLESVNGQRHQFFKHSDMLKAMCSAYPEHSEVVDFLVTDQSMRFRVAQEPVVVGREVAICQGTNNITGHGSALTEWMLFMLICSNGMGVTTHRGGRVRMSHVRRNMAEAMVSRIEALAPRALKYQEAARRDLQEAKNIRFSWAESPAPNQEQCPVISFIEQHGSVPKRVLETVRREGLHHPTSHTYGTLRGAEDALTFVAQQESLEGQKLLEDIALNLRERGLAEARKNQSDLILVRPAA
jgi:hypothetical protein